MAGSIYDEDEAKAKELVDGSYAVYVDKSSKAIKKMDIKIGNEELTHVGGGHYLLPNGEKIKGKEAALEAIKALEALKALEGGEVNGTEVNNGTNNGTGDNTGAGN